MLYLSILVLVTSAFSIKALTIEKCGKVRSYYSTGATAVYDNKNSVYLIGGTRSGKIYKVNIHSGNEPIAEEVGEFPYYVYYEGVGAGDSKGNVYYTGGWGNEMGATTYPFTFKTIFKISPGSTIPTRVASLENERIAMTTVTIDDLVYIIGGNEHYLRMGCDVIETFNMTSGKVQDTIKLPLKMLQHASAAYDGKKIYILGGLLKDNSDRNGTYSGVTTFDPSTREVEILGDFFPIYYTDGAIFVNNTFLIFTGSSAMTFDPVTQAVSYLSASGEGTAVYVPSKDKIYRANGEILCLRISFECTGKPNGLYPDPDNCSKFFICSNDVKHQMTCPDSLHFNPNLLFCDYPKNAGCHANV